MAQAKQAKPVKTPGKAGCAMPALQSALDRESYEWLAENMPPILEALEAEIHNGRTPDQVHLFVLGEYSRPELAQRLRQAARHVVNGAG